MKRKPASKPEPVHRTKQSAQRNKPAMHRTKQKATAYTEREYSGFQQAYDYFNAALFEAALPETILVTLQRRGNTRGYFHADRFNARGQEKIAHEIALNPDSFTGRSDKDILGTLVHEMTHEWQQEFGKPSRNGYHNKQWAAKMKSIGLQPSSTGEADGKETGQRVSHYIVEGGPYDIACDKLLTGGLKLNWQSHTCSRAERTSKTKFTCQRCGMNVWGAPSCLPICGLCAQAEHAALFGACQKLGFVMAPESEAGAKSESYDTKQSAAA